MAWLPASNRSACVRYVLGRADAVVIKRSAWKSWKMAGTRCMCMQSLNVTARPERTMWIKAATSRTWTAWAYHAQQGMVEKSDIFPLFRDCWDMNIRSVAFCIIIPIFMELYLVDYFMHTLFMQITSNLFDCNFMLPLHHQCQLLHG